MCKDPYSNYKTPVCVNIIMGLVDTPPKWMKPLQAWARGIPGSVYNVPMSPSGGAS